MASISGILHTRIRNMVSWYITRVARIQIRIDIPNDCPSQRYADTNTYAEQLASVPADISKPSGAMVMVAAIPNTVFMAIALRIFTMLLVDIKEFPL